MGNVEIASFTSLSGDLPRVLGVVAGVRSCHRYTHTLTEESGALASSLQVGKNEDNLELKSQKSWVIAPPLPQTS